uniref:Uncharacterized protein n=1 Tax=Panagrolaimus sp. JU765 TaxID=591449 RepID=A0AC34R7A9_9BILA
MHKDLRDGKVPELFLSNTSPLLPSTSMAPLPLFRKGDKDVHKLKKNKAFSADAIGSLDPEYLTEALEAIGDEQPIVARSIPKHAVIEVDQKTCQERLRQNCIYEPEVYDKMLAESLAVCDLLQSHLDDCIATTRAKSPSPLSSAKTTPKKQPPPNASPALNPPLSKLAKTSGLKSRASTTLSSTNTAKTRTWPRRT